MFGYLGAPCRTCAAADHYHYRQLFCGVCNVMAQRYGLAARWLINRDSTAPAVAWAAQVAAPPEPILTTCCNPWGQPRLICQAGAGIEFAAAGTLVGLGLKLRDLVADGGWGRRTGAQAVRRLLEKPLRQAETHLGALGFDAAAVDQVWQEQIEIERSLGARRSGSQTLRELAQAAQPTGRLAALVLGHTAHLAGVREQAGAWAALGRVVGETVYWLDAVDDADADRAYGQFNVLNLAVPVVDRPAQRTVARALLAPLNDALYRCTAALSPVRHHDLIRTVFEQRLARRMAHLLQDDAGDGDEAGGQNEQLEDGDDGASNKKRTPSRPRVSGHRTSWWDCSGYDGTGCQGCCDGLWCCCDASDWCDRHGDGGCWDQCPCGGCHCDGCGCDGCGCDGCGNGN